MIGPQKGHLCRFSDCGNDESSASATTNPSAPPQSQIASMEFTVSSHTVKGGRAKSIQNVVTDPAFGEFVALEQRIALLVQFLRPEIAFDVLEFLSHPSLRQSDSQDATRTVDFVNLLQPIKKRSNPSTGSEQISLNIPPMSFEGYASLLLANYADPLTQSKCPETPEELDCSLKARVEMRLKLQNLQNLLQFFTLSSSKVELDNTLAVGAMRQVRSITRILALFSTVTEPSQHGCRISIEDSRVQSKQSIYLRVGAQGRKRNAKITEGPKIDLFLRH
jgi:hypothetical protein